MAFRVPIHRVLVLLALASSACAVSNHLWQWDFETSKKWTVIHTVPECLEAYHQLNKLPKDSGTSKLIDCILENMDEVTKAEFSVVAVMLGLLPGVLQMIGPKVRDLSILATRRPILALFLTIGSPCPAFDYSTTGMESLLVEDAPPVWPKYLRKKRTWLKVAVSLVEYLLVMLAAGNVIYQFYRITFYAVVLISTQLGQYGGTLEAFAPLLWAFLGIPIHALGALQLHWCRISATSDRDSIRRREKTTLSSIIRDEVTPCAFADIEPDAMRLQNGPVFQLLDWVIKLFIWTDVIYGIIVLSTVLFIPMWSAIWMVGLIFTGTVVCRVVLAFEMHGFREVPKIHKMTKYVEYEQARPMLETKQEPEQSHIYPVSDA